MILKLAGICWVWSKRIETQVKSHGNTFGELLSSRLHLATSKHYFFPTSAAPKHFFVIPGLLKHFFATSAMPKHIGCEFQILQLVLWK